MKHRKPKQNRDRLYWKNRPGIRAMTESDMKWIKAAKQMEGEEIGEEFDQATTETLSQYQEHLILEDYNGKFREGYGPVGIVAALTNGYLYEPHVEWFPWATGRNKLRASVAFFQKFRYRNLGVITVHALDEAAPFYRRLKSYVPLYSVGKIPAGDPLGRGDDHIFYMRCRGSV